MKRRRPGSSGRPAPRRPVVGRPDRSARTGPSGPRRQVGQGPDGRPAPVLQRISAPCLRRLGGPATQRPDDAATRRPGDSATQRSGGCAAGRPGGCAVRRLGGWAAQRFGGSQCPAVRARRRGPCSVVRFWGCGPVDTFRSVPARQPPPGPVPCPLRETRRHGAAHPPAPFVTGPRKGGGPQPDQVGTVIPITTARQLRRRLPPDQPPC